VDSSPLCSFSFSADAAEKEKTGVFLQKFAKKVGCRPNWIRKILPLTASVRLFMRGLNVYTFFDLIDKKRRLDPDNAL
jgi:hypothetical protein